MAIIRAQVTIAKDSGLPEDAITNTFHFGTPSAVATPLELTTIGNRLDSFYANFDEHLSAELTNQITIRYYDLAQPTPRIPLLTQIFPKVMSTEGTALPSEVALCLSFAAAPVAGQPPARRRGRLYLGPFSRISSQLLPSRPAVGLVADVVTAATNLMVASATPGASAWGIYSPTVFPAGPNSFNAVASGWVDNAWDTQRRRGVAETSRTVF